MTFMAEDRADENAGRSPGARKVINLDDLEPEITGDPLIDRGMELSMCELVEAMADPDHPDHEAAKAASAHMGHQIRKVLDETYGDQFRRIGDNLRAALKPDLGNLFTRPNVEIARATRGSWAAELSGRPLPDPSAWEFDDTPQRTLEALVEVSERMSEMVRVSAEHREVALRQVDLFQGEAEASRRAERRMFWLTLMAVIGSWVAILVTVGVTLFAK